MATVSIRLMEGRRTEFGDRVGEIRIGDFVEEFHISVEDMSVEQYLEQWRRSTTNMSSGPHTGCLLTSVLQPNAEDGRVFWWVYYRVGDSLVFQNHMLLMSEIEGAFDPQSPEQWIPPRETVTDEGQRISEWRVPLEGLVAEVG